VLVGSSTSANNFLSHHGATDKAIFKLDSNLTLKWSRMFGGSQNETAAKVIQTLDGGFAVIGSSNSRNGNVHFGETNGNGWLIKLNRRNLSFYDDRQLIVRSIPNNLALLNTIRINYKARNVTPVNDTTCTGLQLWQIDTFPVIVRGDTLDDIIEVTNEIKNMSDIKTDPNYNSGVNDSINSIRDTVPTLMVDNCDRINDVLGNCTVTEKSKMQVAFIDSGLDGTSISGKLKPVHTLFDRYIPTTNDSLGYDFVQNDVIPDDVNVYSHGTHVSGITERILSYYGLKGVRFMVLKTQAADGSGSLWNICRAIDYAVCRRVPIVNVSLAYMADGFRLDSGSVVKSLIDTPSFAGSFRSLFVVAAGNESMNVDTQMVDVSCPVRFTSPNILTVAAMKCNRDSAKFTNYGSTSVDIATNGVNIWSTIRTRQWGLLSGTSMATPVVTAAAVILGSQHNLSSQFNAIKVKENILLSRQTASTFLNSNTSSNGALGICPALSRITAVQTLPTTIAKVSPNPFTQSFTIEAADYSFDAPLSIAVYSISGQLMQQHRFAPTFNAAVTVNAQNLPMGIYLVKIQTKDRLFTAKIVKSE
jgi:subtilisin family serine protease